MFLHLLRHPIVRRRVVLIAALLLAVAPALGLVRGAAPTPTLICVLTTPNPQAISSFGSSVAVVDSRPGGSPMLVVGAPWERVGPKQHQGRVYVFSGGSLRYTLTTPAPQAEAFFGWSVAAADVDGDGLPDIVVGAPGILQGVNPLSSPGRTYVFSGASGELLYTLVAPSPQVDARFGSSLAAADVDRDGRADVIVGAPDESPPGDPGEGRAYVFSGESGSLLYTLSSPAPQAYANFGASLAVADPTGGRSTEIIVGSPGQFGPAHVYLFSGPSGQLLSTLSAPNPQPWSDFGASVLPVRGDNDQAAIIVGAPGETVDGNFDQGRAYVFSGIAGTLLNTLDNPDPRQFAQFGRSLAAMRVHGKSEIVVAAPFEPVGGEMSAGRAYVFSGTDGVLLKSLTAINPDIAFFGFSLADEGIKGSGSAMLVVGAPGETVNGNFAQGRVYIFASGGSGRRLSCPGS